MTLLHANTNSHNGGYLIGSEVFLVIFIVAVITQIRTSRFNPWAYWFAIVASTTMGTAMADFFDRSLGIGYTGGSSILFVCVLASLALWRLTLVSVDVQTVYTPKVEIFYWVTITFSQTLGTALGDWTADSIGLGYEGGALVFLAGLVVLAALYFLTNTARVLLFWTAFILTRPLGATVGDFLDKPISHGGFGAEPAARVRGHRRLHHRLRRRAAATRRPPPGTRSTRRIRGRSRAAFDIKLLGSPHCAQVWGGLRANADHQSHRRVSRRDDPMASSIACPPGDRL